MQQKKQKIPFCLIWFIIAVVCIIIFQIWHCLALARLFDITTYVCYVNNTNSTDKTDNGVWSFCTFGIVTLSGIFVICGCITIIQIGWISIGTFAKKQFDTIQEKNCKLGIRVKELQRALTERNIGNIVYVNIGRPDNDLPPYTGLPNERGHLLTQSQLPNYQSVEIN